MIIRAAVAQTATGLHARAIGIRFIGCVLMFALDRPYLHE